MKQEFEMTKDDLKKILDACKPTPVMYLSGGSSMFRTPQENANEAWAELGERMGFDHMTVEPIRGKSQRFFLAVSTKEIN